MEPLTNLLPDGVLTSKETRRRIVKPDLITLIGYGLLVISASAYALEETEVIRVELRSNSLNLTTFFVHYFLSFGYGITLLFDKSYVLRNGWSRRYINKTIISLNLFLVSAYALNRELPVFAESVDWLSVHLILTSLVTLTYPYIDILPKYLKYIHHTVLGTSLILFLYMTIYVANMYIFGAIGLIFFGVGGHIFVPAFFIFTLIKLTIATHRNKKIGVGWIYLGATTAVVIVGTFFGEWKSRTNEINRLANQSVIYSDTELPAWVKVARSVKNDWLTRMIIKSGLGYSVRYNHSWQWFGIDRSWDERQLHDPLVFIASDEISSLSLDDRKNILKTFGNENRHKAQQRLWSGNDLSTSYIVSDVDIYPALRLAYSEQYINVKNSAESDWSQQEAIYTFQLPEGSVVTSLSLWINGTEEKAVLTSKQQATQAYNTIVAGRRDPSVIHWQEGNTVSVRVFPCTPESERKFKIGITSPLSVVDGKTIYKNVSFKGPSAVEAQQTSRIRIIGQAGNIEVPGGFTKNVKSEYVREGTYEPNMEITMDATPLQENHFSFDGYTYSLSNLQPATAPVGFKDIYLDINSSWTPVDLHELRPMLDGYNVYAYITDDFIRVTKENWDDVVKELTVSNFSLFPFHHVKNIDRSLVITKGEDLSPQLLDFKKSKFADGIGEYFAAGNKIYVFDLEGKTSSYIRSLRELRAFHFAQGNTKELEQLLTSKKFPLTEESDYQAVLHDSKMVIHKTVQESREKNNAPDHLARLFAYNDIMRKVGTNFFKDEFVSADLVDEAQSAYVVSPVSSLIVLESQEDYDRFGIKDKENSLHNATKDSSGAVPEPHEWALIVMFLGLIVFQIYKYYNARYSSNIN